MAPRASKSVHPSASFASSARLKALGAVAAAALSFGVGVWMWPGVGFSAMLSPAPHGAVARGTPEAATLRAEALRALDDAGSDAARADAIVLLGFVGDDRDVPRLLDVVRDGSPSLAQSAVDALGHVGTPSAVDALVALGSKPGPMRWSAWMALGASTSPRALDALTARLDEGEDVDAVAGALARTGSPEGARALAKAFPKATSAEVSSIAEALASFSHDVPEAHDALYRGLADHQPDRRNAAMMALARAQDPDLYDRLEDVVRDGTDGDQAEVAIALGQMKDDRAVPLLAELARKSGPAVQPSAIAALGQVGSDEAVAVLLDLAEHASPDVASQAIWALPSVQSQDVVDVLARVAEDRPIAAQEAACGRLFAGPWGHGELPDGVLDLARAKVERPGPNGAPVEAFQLLLDHGDKTDQQRFAEAIENAPTWQRVNAITALRGHDAPWIRELLLDLAVDPDSQVSSTAIDVLVQGDAVGRAKLEDRLLTELDDGNTANAEMGLARLGTARALQALVDRIENGTTYEAQQAISSIASWGDAEAVQALVGLLDDVDDVSVRQTLFSSVLYRNDVDLEDLASRALADDDPTIRSYATQLLARQGTPEARRQLVDMAKSGDDDVRASALMALGQVGGPEAEQIAIAALDDPQLGSTAMSTLQTLGTPAARKAIADAALHAKDASIRTQAVYSLGCQPDRGTADILVQAMKDDDPSVRMAAITQIQTVGGTAGAEALGEILDRGEDPDDPNAVNERWQAAMALQNLGGPIAKEHQEQIQQLMGSNPYLYEGEGGMWLDDVVAPSANPYPPEDAYEVGPIPEQADDLIQGEDVDPDDVTVVPDDPDAEPDVGADVEEGGDEGQGEDGQDTGFAQPAGDPLAWNGDDRG